MGSSPTGSITPFYAAPTTVDAWQHPLALHLQSRQRGGIEPLCITAPRELKSRPGTSLSHPGMRVCHRELLTFMLLVCLLPNAELKRSVRAASGDVLSSI